jgi:hypothetical protein
MYFMGSTFSQSTTTAGDTIFDVNIVIHYRDVSELSVVNSSNVLLPDAIHLGAKDQNVK